MIIESLPSMFLAHSGHTGHKKQSVCKLTPRTMKLEVREQKGHKLKVIPGQEQYLLKSFLEETEQVPDSVRI